MRRLVASLLLLALCLSQNQTLFAQEPRARITPAELPAIPPLRAQLVMAARCDSAMVPALLPPVTTPAYFKDSSSKVSDLQVEFDLSQTQQNIYNQILQLTNSPDKAGTCDDAALKVAGHALFYWDIQKHLRSALKNTADAIRDGAKLGGASSVAKVAQIAGEIISAYDTDQPEAAIGRSIINNSVDWAVDQAKGKAKTGNEDVDDKLKEGAKAAGEKAKEKLINALFGGPLAKGITERTVIPEMRYCAPTVTFEFQPPAGASKGGLYLLVQGTCDCNDKNNLIKLRYFYVSVFLPLTGMDARLEWGRSVFAKAFDVKDLIKSSKAFKKGIEDSMKEPEGEEKPPDLQELYDDVKKKAGNASDITPTLILIPRFAKPTLENVNIRSECGCENVTETYTPPPEGGSSTVPRQPEQPRETPAGQVERVCRHQCDGLYQAWQAADKERTDICFQFFQSGGDKRLSQECKQARERSDSAKVDYYRCLERCYKGGVGAGLIPEVPKEITDGAHPAPPPKPPVETPPPPKPQTPPPPPPKKPKIQVDVVGEPRTETPPRPKKGEIKVTYSTTATTPRGETANVLPDGAVYAEATVEPNSTIEVQQPGYALVATADVVTARRVKPGDKLDGNTTRSLYFDDGRGLIIHEVEGKAVDKLTAMVGGQAFTDGASDKLPVFNGTVTTCVQSDRPFDTPSIASDGANHTPAQTNAVIRNAQGQKVGEFATFTGVKGSNVSVRTLDKNGATTGEAHVAGGTLDGTPSVAFDSPTYKEGQGGTLNIGNQQYYQAFVSATRFGDVDVTKMPIRFLVISDVRGIPPEVPFGTTSVGFTAGKAGQARVQVLMPGLSPPRPADPQNSNPDRRQASPAFTEWLNEFQPQ